MHYIGLVAYITRSGLNNAQTRDSINSFLLLTVTPQKNSTHCTSPSAGCSWLMVFQNPSSVRRGYPISESEVEVKWARHAMNLMCALSSALCLVHVVLDSRQRLDSNSTVFSISFDRGRVAVQIQILLHTDQLGFSLLWWSLFFGMIQLLLSMSVVKQYIKLNSLS